MSGIYKITNKVNNKVYIGQSINIEGRFYQHKNCLNRNVGHNSHFQNAWNKYGEENFEFELIHIVSNVEELNDLEIYYIKKYNSNNPKFGYNITSGGDAPFFNEEYRKEISKMFNTSTKVITNIVTGKAFSYVATELNDKIVNIKQNFIKERNEKILNLYDELHSIKKVCDLTGYTISVVEKAVYKTNKYKNDKFIKIYDEVINLYNEGYNQSEIARKLNIGGSTVNRYVRGLTNPNNELPFKKVTKDIEKEIIKLYLNNMSMVDIGKKFNISHNTVSNYIKQYEYANTEVS